MKKKSEKQADLVALRDLLATTPNVFVTSFEKMTVAQDYQLRKTVRAAGGLYKVIKNTLAAKAGTGTPAESVTATLAGMTSIAYTATDPVALAKALTKYAKDNPAFTFKAGIVEGRVFNNVKDIEALASMPSKEEIYAKLLYVINAPAQRLVTAINGVGRNLAVVIDQGVKENKFSA
ncbi:MAG: 50S ribosomal protein L10 [Acidobacteria bacterium]|nr:50S ribosomal protein L10 [Acidobacteriota bacterium]